MKPILTVYAVQRLDGHYFVGRDDEWSPNLADARIYEKIGPAKAQATVWSKEQYRCCGYDVRVIAYDCTSARVVAAASRKPRTR